MTKGNDIKHLTVDFRNLNCPEPVLRTKKLFDNASIESVEILVDGQVNVNNLERLSKSLKLHFQWQKEQKQSCFRVHLSRQQLDSAPNTDKKPHQQTGTIEPELVSDSPLAGDLRTGTVIFLNKDIFGEGDREFSQHLLNIFLQSVLQSGHIPRAILLANSGVRLMSNNSIFRKALADFIELDVPVLACGLCVEFYGLGDIIPAEQITNMFAICEYLFAAERVITP